jgi:type I restriction enzyme S subunit
LERIREEKQRLVKEGKIKKQKPLPEIKPEEVPFELPEGWEWVRLGSTGVCGTGKTPKTSDREFYDSGEVPFIGPGQITGQGHIIAPDKYITKKAFEHSNIAKEKDILMVCIGGSIGKCAVVRNKVAFNQQINCISPLLVEFKYVFYAMKTSIFQSSLLSKSTGSATPIINRLKWEELKIPLPPLSEQPRIVAKVDQLMTLCDELEYNLYQSHPDGEKLLKAVVEKFSSSGQPSETIYQIKTLYQ